MDTTNPTGDQAAPGHPEEGLSILDLASLSASQLQVMRIILREVEITYDALCQSIDLLPDIERLSRTALDDTLQELLQNEWLIEIGAEAESKAYKANLRRKSSRTISDFVAPRSRRQGTSSNLRNIWDSIEKDEK